MRRKESAVSNQVHRFTKFHAPEDDTNESTLPDGSLHHIDDPLLSLVPQSIPTSVR